MQILLLVNGRLITAAVGWLIVACLIGGCNKSDSASTATTQSSASAGTKTFTIGMSQANLGEPWRVQMNADIKAAADKVPNLTVVFKDAQNDTLKQRSQVEEFVSQKVDLLIISPKEAQPLTDPVAAAMDAGIPVIVLDRKVIGDKYTTFIGADNKLIGRRAGEWIVKKLNGKGNVVELEGLMTSTPAQERHAGFIEGIAGSDVKVLVASEMKWLEPNARSEAESALARFNNIDLIFAHNDPGAHGAYLAAQAAGREEKHRLRRHRCPSAGRRRLRPPGHSRCHVSISHGRRGSDRHGDADPAWAGRAETNHARITAVHKGQCGSGWRAAEVSVIAVASTASLGYRTRRSNRKS